MSPSAKRATMTREENELRYERGADEAERLAASLARTEQQEAECRQTTKKEIERGSNGAALSSSNEFSERRGGWPRVARENEMNREAERRMASLRADARAARTAY